MREPLTQHGHPDGWCWQEEILQEWGLPGGHSDGPSRGQGTQYLARTWNGKESEKRINVCLCITETLCSTP